MITGSVAHIRQPMAPAWLERTDPANKGLVFDYDPVMQKDLANSGPATNNGSTRTTGRNGAQQRNFVAGSSQSVNLGPRAEFAFGGGNFSFEVIATIGTYGAVAQMFLGKMDAFLTDQFQFYAGVLGSGTPNFTLSWCSAGAPVQVAYTSSGITVAAGVRYHIVMQRVGSSAECWVNGVSYTFTVTGTNQTMNNCTGVNALIGTRTSSARDWDGSIELCRVRNRALSPGEVKRLYERPYCGRTSVRNRLFQGAVGAGAFSAAWAHRRAHVIGAGAH